MTLRRKINWDTEQKFSSDNVDWPYLISFLSLYTLFSFLRVHHRSINYGLMAEKGYQLCFYQGFWPRWCDVFCLLYFRGLGKQGYQCQGEKDTNHVINRLCFVLACRTNKCAFHFVRIYFVLYYFTQVVSSQNSWAWEPQLPDLLSDFFFVLVSVCFSGFFCWEVQLLFQIKITMRSSKSFGLASSLAHFYFACILFLWGKNHRFAFIIWFLDLMLPFRWWFLDFPSFFFKQKIISSFPFSSLDSFYFILGFCIYRLTNNVNCSTNYIFQYASNACQNDVMLNFVSGFQV